jgi:cytochrome c
VKGKDMKKIMAIIAAIMFVASLAGSAHAEGKADEVKALVKKAIEYLKANGKEKAIAAFNDQKGEFCKGELYIFVVDSKDCITMANGGNPKLNGRSYCDMKDADGKFFQKEFITVGLQGGGWVEYKWTNPETKKIAPKTTYVENLNGLIVGSGYYK